MNAQQQVLDNLGLARYWARQYKLRAPRMEWDELEAAAMLGLCRAATYWRANGRPFAAYATHGIRAAITDVIEFACDRGVRLPTRTREQVRAMGDCGDNRDAIEQALGRHVSPRRVVELMLARMSRRPYGSLAEAET